MPRVYIAGPMRGLPLYNFPAFDAAADVWRRIGFEVINPAEVDRIMDGLDPYDPHPMRTFEEYMRRDIKLLLQVDAIAFLPGWQHSTGAVTEYMVGAALGLALFDAETQTPLVDPRSFVLLSAPPARHISLNN